MIDSKARFRKKKPTLFLLLSAMNGWSLVLVGGVSLIASLLMVSGAGIVISAAVTLHGAIELRFRKRFKLLSSRSIARRMAFNQLGLAVSLSLYFIYQFSIIDGEQVKQVALSSPVSEILSLYPEAIRVELVETLPSLLGWAYLTGLGIGWVACGACALYYWWQGEADGSVALATPNDSAGS